MELMCSCAATPLHVNFRLFKVIDDTVQVFVMLNVKLLAKLAPVPWNAGAGEAASCRPQTTVERVNCRTCACVVHEPADAVAEIVYTPFGYVPVFDTSHVGNV